MMDDFVEDYVAFKLFEESLCETTDLACPSCEASLLFDRERQLFLCPECRGEFVADERLILRLLNALGVFWVFFSGMKKGASNRLIGNPCF